MNPLEEDVYTDFVRPENMVGVDQSKLPPTLSRQPATSARRYRLSLSPLDSLQAEFKRYNSTESSGSLRLSHPSNQRVLVSAAFDTISSNYSHMPIPIVHVVYSTLQSTSAVSGTRTAYCTLIYGIRTATITPDISFTISSKLRRLST